ncbi:hypothetical protein GCM10009733_020790 [Nonomuraea maheshkhaliensis]|uniref:Uncharacterized protein n=1 Tax=Nonomuraea maheshkhaliensis TaxID=419590 RepID=A0ABN2F1T1_9ACTN
MILREAIELLLKAADVQEANGLHQVGWYDRGQAATLLLDPRKCRVCPIGAIATAAGLFPSEITSSYSGAQRSRQAAVLLATYLIEHRLAEPPHDGGIGDIEVGEAINVIGPNWADKPGQTASSLATTMRAAAA